MKTNFVWYGAVIADEIGTAGQAYQAMNRILSENAVKNKPEGKKPADIRYIGTALGTMTIPGGKQTTVRFIVVTAEPKYKRRSAPESMTFFP